MIKAAELLSELFQNNRVRTFTLGSPRTREPQAYRKITGKLIVLKGKPAYQFERFSGNKVTHLNLLPANASDQLIDLLATDFRQVHLRTDSEDIHIVISESNNAKVTTKPKGKVALQPLNTSHDRVKQHIIPENQPCDFLYRLGIMTQEGQVVASRRDKFKQVNKFLEMVAPVADAIEKSGNRDEERPLRIVDFGCGKSYLTFAVYHYFKCVRNWPVEVIGIDRKSDVLAFCTKTAAELGYEGLQFVSGEIGDSAIGERADLVISLHACNTATDAALAQAVKWNTTAILAAPCCQHELNKQLDNPQLSEMLQYGIVRERLTALVTDTLRASLLEAQGYSVQLLEFIDPEHTPKNTLIKAVRKDAFAESARAEATTRYESLRDFWHVAPAFERILNQNGRS